MIETMVLEQMIERLVSERDAQKAIVRKFSEDNADLRWRIRNLEDKLNKQEDKEMDA